MCTVGYRFPHFFLGTTDGVELLHMRRSGRTDVSESCFSSTMNRAIASRTYGMISSFIPLMKRMGTLII